MFLANTIVPSALHAPAGGCGAAGSVCTGAGPDPNCAETVLSFPCAKKPIERLSGDQNGSVAPAVPLIATDVEESSARIHSAVCPEAARAVNASRAPSDEIAGEPTNPAACGSQAARPNH